VAHLTDDVTGALRRAYGAAASAWAGVPGTYYRKLGDALVGAARDEIRGGRVLDVGTGTGAVAAAAVAAGARWVVGTDLAFGMVNHASAARPVGVVAGASRLPFVDGAFDAAVAGCVLNHIPIPSGALREMARVARRGGVVLASTFRAGPSHPVKECVDTALAPFGFVSPPWHDALKEEIEPLTATPERLLAVARDAGLTDVSVVEHTIDSGLRSAEELVELRFGMASSAPFVARLDEVTRARAFAAAVAAVGPDPEPFVARLLVLRVRL
jgi:SAM-dependent methyltransferase